MKRIVRRPRLYDNEIHAHENITSDEKRFLVIGDLHEPFSLDGYLEHCIETYQKWNCNHVIFIGDIIDNHFASYHETDPDGFSAGDELDYAIDRVADWYEAFPDADVLIGNHDALIQRKIYSGGLPKRWIKSYNEVLGTPNWRWHETLIINDICFEHGIGGQAITKAKNNMMSSVCGHIHTEAYVKWFVGKRFKIFAMQIGSGLDAKAYSAAYARAFKKQCISCGVILGNKIAFNVMMNL